MPIIDYRLKDIPADLWAKDRWNVLTFLLLHANVRNRCWPSMKRIALRMGRSPTTIQHTRDWLVEHSAVRIIAYAERIGLEKSVPPRQFIYELSGIVHIGNIVYPYLYLPDQNGEISEDPKDGSLKVHDSGSSKPSTLTVFSKINTTESSLGDTPAEHRPKQRKQNLLMNAIAKAFFEGVTTENNALVTIVYGHRKTKPHITGLLDREAARQKVNRADLDLSALARLVPLFKDTLSDKGISELRSPQKFLLRWDGWRNTSSAGKPPRLTYDPNCPHCQKSPGMIHYPDGSAGPCVCRQRILAQRED